LGVLVAPVEARRESVWSQGVRRLRFRSDRAAAFAVVSAATALAVGIEGYHPYAEDGGIYVAGVKRLLDAGLYPHDAAFAMEPARWSLFAPMVAALVRVTHVPLPWMLLALHVATVWATLFGTWMLAARCFARAEARAGAVVLLACWLGLPVAGTALYVMDPYLTARSLATPAMLLAMVGALEATAWKEGSLWPRRRGWMTWMVGLAACAMMHPLTALYATIATVVLACLRARHSEVRIGGTAALCVTAIAAAACAQMFVPAETAAYLQAALSRSYWFLSQWRWYEMVGLAAPVAILGAVGWLSRRGEKWNNESGATRALARMAVIAAALACGVVVLFAREDATRHLVARMQPLRMFQMVYVVMVMVIGGRLGDIVVGRSAWRWAASVTVLGGVMFGAARAEYAHTSHLELPWTHSRNAWVQGFEWVRGNTPKDGLFAMDADYIHAPGEDAQNFRAIAERSVLPDASKDGGEASIAPDLAKAWAQGVAAQDGLSAISDGERVARLTPLGVTWIVLDAGARTQFECPYASAQVRVCRIGSGQ
jgi:hypothetical protein